MSAANPTEPVSRGEQGLGGEAASGSEPAVVSGQPGRGPGDSRAPVRRDGSRSGRKPGERKGAKHGRKCKCVCCGVEVKRRHCHKNRFGEYVCQKCHDEGRRGSAIAAVRRWVRRLYRKAVAKWQLVLLFILAPPIGIWLFWRMLDRVVQNPN